MLSSFSFLTNRIIILSCDLVDDGEAPAAAVKMAVADELLTTIFRSPVPPPPPQPLTSAAAASSFSMNDEDAIAPGGLVNILISVHVAKGKEIPF